MHPIDLEPPGMAFVGTALKLALIIGLLVLLVVAVAAPWLILAFAADQGLSVSHYHRGLAGIWATLCIVAFALGLWRLWSW